MIQKITKTIDVLFFLLFALVPIVLWPKTSEVFEFNKIVVVYVLTTLIVSFWLIKCIVAKKPIFRRTILDIPLLIFLASQILSTFFSIDVRTSIFGYYSRFNGGALSLISYSLLYWAFVSNMNKSTTLKLIYYSILPTGFLVSFYGILEHFGIDKNVWVQDVQTRVFSTLGQPNWLATWIVALIPVSWAFSLKQKIKSKEFLIFSGLSLFFFTTLLFTKSRSGILGFIFADVIFWGLVLLKYKKQFLREFLIHNSLFFVLVILIGSPWTPPLSEIKGPTQASVQNTSGASVLETGGTESGTIREIVWKGAIDIWAHYPILGTGPETFAFSYYLYRPAAHNLVSEWDFLYNKAHNEYLNYAANTGSVGLVSYLALIGFSIYQILNIKIQKSKIKDTNQNSKLNILRNFSILNCDFDICILNFALLSGYVSILVSNFFGFSVVPIQIESFLFPALAIALTESGIKNEESRIEKLSGTQKITSALAIILASYFLILISRYWYADVLYARGTLLNQAGRFVEAQQTLTSAIGLSFDEPIYHGEITQSYVGIALAFDANKAATKAASFANAAIAESNVATTSSPANLNLKRNAASMYIKLSEIDPKYLLDANKVLQDAVKSAPTEAKLYYNLGLTYARIGDFDNAIKTLEKTVELKPDYRDARFALALVLVEKKEFKPAQDQLKYILEKINSNDEAVKNQLKEIQ